MKESRVQGLKYENDMQDKKFVRFFDTVQAEARKQNRVFFIDTGEGNEIVTENINCEDLSGWLIPPEDIAEFEPQWANERAWHTIDDRFHESFVFARWSMSDEGDVKVWFD
jgi:hypothetical protein